jgi:hypothetical protein
MAYDAKARAFWGICDVKEFIFWASQALGVLGACAGVTASAVAFDTFPVVHVQVWGACHAGFVRVRISEFIKAFSTVGVALFELAKRAVVIYYWIVFCSAFAIALVGRAADAILTVVVTLGAGLIFIIECPIFGAVNALWGVAVGTLPAAIGLTAPVRTVKAKFPPLAAGTQCVESFNLRYMVSDLIGRAQQTRLMVSPSPGPRLHPIPEFIVHASNASFAWTVHAGEMLLRRQLLPTNVILAILDVDWFTFAMSIDCRVVGVNYQKWNIELSVPLGSHAADWNTGVSEFEFYIFEQRFTIQWISRKII